MLIPRDFETFKIEEFYQLPSLESFDQNGPILATVKKARLEKSEDQNPRIDLNTLLNRQEDHNNTQMNELAQSQLTDSRALSANGIAEKIEMANEDKS